MVIGSLRRYRLLPLKVMLYFTPIPAAAPVMVKSSVISFTMLIQVMISSILCPVWTPLSPRAILMKITFSLQAAVEAVFSPHGWLAGRIGSPPLSQRNRLLTGTVLFSPLTVTGFLPSIGSRISPGISPITIIKGHLSLL